MFEIDFDHPYETTESPAIGVARSLWLQVAFFVNWESEAFETNLRHAHKLRRTDRGDYIEYIGVFFDYYIAIFRKSKDANVGWIDSHSAVFGLQSS